MTNTIRRSPSGEIILATTDDIENLSTISGESLTDALDALNQIVLQGPRLMASLGASTPTATNAVTNLSAGAFTIPANDITIGRTYRGVLDFELVHAAGSTPTVTSEWVFGGALIANFNVVPNTIADTYQGSLVTLLRFTSLGVAGTARVSLRPNNDLGLNIQIQNGGVQGALSNLNTTISRTLELRTRMTTAVPANTLTLINATVEQLN